MRFAGKTREQVEKQLLDALAEARTAYEKATGEARSAVRTATDVGGHTPDGFLAGRKADLHTSSALRALIRYRKILAAFTEFSVSGKPPEDGEIS